VQGQELCIQAQASKPEIKKSSAIVRES